MIRPRLTLAVVLALSSVLSGAQTQSWQTGRVVALEKHEAELPCCYSPTDAPLKSNVIMYDVSVQIGDTVYVGRYETSIDYVPANWAKDCLVLARPNKHFIYLETSSGQEKRLSLLSRRRYSGSNEQR